MVLMRLASEAQLTYRQLTVLSCGLKEQSWAQMVISDTYALGSNTLHGHRVGGWGFGKAAQPTRKLKEVHVPKLHRATTDLWPEYSDDNLQLAKYQVSKLK